MVEWPVRALSASTPESVSSGRRLESLATKPALCALTRRTISACCSTGCDAYRNARPPSRASAMAMRSSDTACMMADTSGMFSMTGLCSPRAKRTTGVRSDTLAGMQSLAV